MGILPRSVWREAYALGYHLGNTIAKFTPVNLVAIRSDILWCRVIWKDCNDLLDGLFKWRLIRDGGRGPDRRSRDNIMKIEKPPKVNEIGLRVSPVCSGKRDLETICQQSLKTETGILPCINLMAQLRARISIHAEPAMLHWQASIISFL